ncbi:alpha-glucosidase [Guyanagaster necrorhizus]|uniref:Glucosidase II subunit alpha n=1 Tax=Guyanagaster necrorhizus TaxID=856835 RepID=A0A9P7W2X4_9AGAR|nr:alpha-glucosidase [Guyanagaster necrorhizus MCA 3950]KAG7452386.1 alpha-glucosidase [Guyanagaster necrorhizus MCA 3950]
MRASVLFGALFFAILAPDALSVKTNDWKTCSQSGFCRRGRALSARAKDATSTWKSPYSVDPSSVSISPGEAVVTAAVKSSLYPEIKFELEVRVHEDGVVRVRMDEKDGLRKRYDEAASWALAAEPVVSKVVQWAAGKKDVRAVYGDLSVVIAYEPLRVTLLRKGREQVILNGQGLLHMEHFRNKESPPDVQADEASEESQVPIKAGNPRAWFEGEEEDTFWDEKFNSWTDSKPKGPESLSLDITFPNHGTVYGVPQHATRLALPSTTGDDATFSDPYRLYNADVFEYLASSTMSLYGSIPVMHAHSTDSTVAIFHAVASETWIDVHHPTSQSSHSHWISESGIMDVFLLPGPTPKDVFAQYARLTGYTPLPAHWSLGYHQCRWNYVSTDDVRIVQKRFDEEDMPVDVFWLDIEYAEEHKYFIWDQKTFPDPIEMTNDVAAVARKMVVIIDPHLKRTSNYPVYQEASDLGILVKPKSGEGEYEGWCWSGSSSWIDMFNPASWDWWKSIFKFQRENGWSWTNSTDAVHIWNDMNEPSVFNGPEITMPKDNIHYGGWEHRDIHNINGMLFHNLTSQAVAERTTPHKRPFVLTRSFYAGSQRFGATWTGDNLGTWDHMTAGVQMVLANGIAGMTFAGSDVGGFFGNPDMEMLVRWYQVGIFSPFFRAHAHIDTKRREPFLLDEPHKGMIKDILRLRYSMLPVWYTVFWESSRTGVPVLRHGPHYVMFPKDKEGFEIDDQFFVGSSGLLVKPVTKKDITETTVYLAEDQVYYNYFTEAPSYGSSKGKQITVPLELSTIPLYIRGGSIIPTRERPRRSSPLMAYDPFTLRVALDKTGFSAKGDLYLDDGDGLAYQDGDYVWREFIAEKNGKKGVKLANKNLSAEREGEYEESIKDVRVEKVSILGLANEPKEVRVVGREEPLAWMYKTVAADKGKKAVGVLVIKDPAVLITKDWEIIVDV